MAIPVGSLYFTGFGNSPSTFGVFRSPTGAALTPPAANPDLIDGPIEGVLQLEDGTWCFANFQNFEQRTFSFDFATTNTDGTFQDGKSIASNYVDAFYTIFDVLHTDPATLQKYTNTCVRSTSWSLGFNGDVDGYCLGVASDESVAYYGKRSFSDTVYARDLVGLTTSVFATEVGGVLGRSGSIVVLRNSEVLILWGTLGGSFVKHYSAAGAVLHTYTIPDLGGLYMTQGLTDASFWVSRADSTPTGFSIMEIRIADGATLHDFTPPNDGFFWDGPFCVVRVSPEAAPTSTIIVTKTTSPSGDPNAFTIAAGGGLSPETFILRDGESQTFEDVAADESYSIAEAPAPGYTTSIVVSNGDDPSDIIPAADETVTVTIINTRRGIKQNWQLYRFDIKPRPEETA